MILAREASVWRDGASRRRCRTDEPLRVKVQPEHGAKS